MYHPNKYKITNLNHRTNTATPSKKMLSGMMKLTHPHIVTHNKILCDIPDCEDRFFLLQNIQLIKNVSDLSSTDKEHVTIKFNYLPASKMSKPASSREALNHAIYSYFYLLDTMALMDKAGIYMCSMPNILFNNKDIPIIDAKYVTHVNQLTQIPPFLSLDLKIGWCIAKDKENLLPTLLDHHYSLITPSIQEKREIDNYAYDACAKGDVDALIQTHNVFALNAIIFCRAKRTSAKEHFVKRMLSGSLSAGGVEEMKRAIIREITSSSFHAESSYFFECLYATFY